MGNEGERQTEGLLGNGKELLGRLGEFIMLIMLD